MFAGRNECKDFWNSAATQRKRCWNQETSDRNKSKKRKHWNICTLSIRNYYYNTDIHFSSYTFMYTAGPDHNQRRTCSCSAVSTSEECSCGAVFISDTPGELNFDLTDIIWGSLFCTKIAANSWQICWALVRTLQSSWKGCGLKYFPVAMEMPIFYVNF